LRIVIIRIEKAEGNNKLEVETLRIKDRKDNRVSLEKVEVANLLVVNLVEDREENLVENLRGLGRLRG
jgi:hypothetical protein